jgi:hypothetical protein
MVWVDKLSHSDAWLSLDVYGWENRKTRKKKRKGKGELVRERKKLCHAGVARDGGRGMYG